VALTLIIGNKNYSSWSLRPWIALKFKGISFDEIVIPLYLPGSPEEILKYSPAGKVPVLIHDDEHVWESLAVLEHLAERFPDAHLWPEDARATATVAPFCSAPSLPPTPCMRRWCRDSTTTAFR